MAKDYSQMDKEELLEEIKKLESRKSYGLVWEDKPEDVVEQCKTQIPILDEVSKRLIEEDVNKPNNLLIEGDNYHALSVLNYTHRQKIDAIYIDPPYNTGARDWKYNNNYIDSNDAYRHSKWLSFMDKRLRLAKNLLKTTGIIVVTIDDYEIATLTLLMDEIFGQDNHLGTVVIKHNPSGRSTVSGFSVNHEYALFYSLSSASKIGRLPHSERQISRYKEKDDNGYFEWENFRKNGTDSNREDRPKQFYPIAINLDTHKIRIPSIKWNVTKKSYDILEQISDKETILLPINKGIEKVWKYGLERTSEIINELLVKSTKDGLELYRKKYLNNIGSLPRTWWDKPEYSARDSGTRTLANVLGSAGNFDFPKAPKAVEDCIQVTNVPKDGIVLDFFSGSGTTGHAVLNLNQQDGGNRKFILCTNNENKIAEEVTYPRIEKVVKGYNDTEGIPSNLRYYKTDFVDVESVHNVSDQKKVELTYKAGRMIALREDTLEEIEKNDWWQIFTDKKDRMTAIYFKEDKEKIDELIKKLSKSDAAALYIFSWGKNEYKNEYTEYKNIRVEDIPEPILEVYKEINKK